ncbi:hypothetical protein NDU88_001624 [Pleurodeles waltl]|uniref:Uncharacterized protein n=1 Tax=Pleurodeles waltl TaxID=8319 RepID=A0AAV7TKN4_PLEWA|nr:hypothetical protein NDU88_001624 [Pleurodeles waltl]
MDQLTTTMAAGGGTADGLQRDVSGSPPLTDKVVLLKVIQDSREKIKSKLDSIKTNLSLVRQDLRRVAERVTEAETWLSLTEDEMTTLQKRVSQLT